MSAKPVLDLSENAWRGKVLPGQVSPVPTLSFVVETREKAKVSRRFLSENLFW